MIGERCKCVPHVPPLTTQLCFQCRACGGWRPFQGVRDIRKPIATAFEDGLQLAKKRCEEFREPEGQKRERFKKAWGIKWQTT